MKTVLKLAGVLLVAFALAACSAIDAGTITKKNFRPAYTWIETVYDCYQRDKNGLCTMQIPRTVYHHEPDRYSFDITAGEQSGWVVVDPATYADYEVGEYYPREDRGSRPQ